MHALSKSKERALSTSTKTRKLKAIGIFTLLFYKIISIDGPMNNIKTCKYSYTKDSNS
jgi:hypothetical protein